MILLGISSEEFQMSNIKFLISNITKQEGFTFIELILYVSMVTGILAALVPFAWNIIEGQSKSNTQQEVYTQARYLSERIKKEIRAASSVSVCSTSELYLVNPVAAQSIRFCVASGAISFNQGDPPAACPGLAANRLHSVGTSVSLFSCTNLTGSGAKNIQFGFTMTDNYPSTQSEYQETVQMQSAAELRN